jgi:hypothetical protein
MIDGSVLKSFHLHGMTYILAPQGSMCLLSDIPCYSVTVLQAESEQDLTDWVNSLKMVNQLALNSDKTLASSFRIFGGGKVRNVNPYDDVLCIS